MTQTKLFRGLSEAVDTQLNRFLQTYPDIEVIDVKFEVDEKHEMHFALLIYKV